MMTEQRTALEQVFGEMISSYSRREAIEDGVLVDLTDSCFTFRPGLNICKEAGFKFPIAMTVAAFAKTVQEEGVELPPCQDISGRLWDVLWMLKCAIARSRSTDVIRYQLNVWNWIERGGKRINRAKHELVQLKALCGPGDDGEPVVTIMLPDED